MNPLSTIPGKYRLALYLVFGIGNVVVGYLVAKGIAGDAEVIGWNALGVVFGLTAASNTPVHETKVINQ